MQAKNHKDAQRVVKERDRAIAEESRLTLTVDEAADILGIGRSSAYALARRGAIPSIRLGHRLLVPKAALEKLLAGA